MRDPRALRKFAMSAASWAGSKSSGSRRRIGEAVREQFNNFKE